MNEDKKEKCLSIGDYLFTEDGIQFKKDNEITLKLTWDQILRSYWMLHPQDLHKTVNQLMIRYQEEIGFFRD